MKDKLLQALKLKFVGVPEAILERIAAKKSIGLTDESQIDATAAAVTFEIILQSEVDSKITDSNKKAVENYEAKHNIKDGKPKTAEEEKKTELPTTLDPAVKLLFEQQQKMIETLTGTVQGYITGQTKQTNAEKAKAELIKIGVPASFLSLVPLEAETPEDIPALVERIKSGYDTILQEQVNAGTVIVKPVAAASGDVGKEPTTATIGNYLDEKFGAKEEKKV